MHETSIEIAVVSEATAQSLTPVVATVALSGNIAGADATVEVIGEASPIVIVGVGASDISIEAVSQAVPVAIGPIYQPPAAELKNPVLTYSGGLLSQIDYDGPHRKTFAYMDNRLRSIDDFDGFRTARKTFSYDETGALIGVSETAIL